MSGQIPSPAPPGENENDRLYRAALALVGAHLPLHGSNPDARAGFFLRRRLRKGVAMLRQVIAINPRNWPAMWVAGMASRRAGDAEAALALFESACAVCRTGPVQDNHADVWREASLTAMHLGRSSDAVEYARRAIEVRPGDPGLVANVALAHLFNQNPAEAKRAAYFALAAAPDDEVTRRVVKLIGEVLAGERPCPRHHRDVR